MTQAQFDKSIDNICNAIERNEKSDARHFIRSHIHALRFDTTSRNATFTVTSQSIDFLLSTLHDYLNR